MLAIRLPNGARLGPAAGGRIVLGRANLASLALGPAGVSAISRQQAELIPEDASPGTARLRATGCNAIVVEKPAAGGAEEWATCDVLEKGESTLVQAGMRFYVASLQQDTTCLLEPWDGEDAAPSAGTSSLPQQQQQQAAGPHQPVDLTLSDHDETAEDSGPAPKRQRREAPSDVPCTTAAALVDQDTPFSLFRVRGIPAAFNTGQMLGASLCDLVVGQIQLAVVENYLIDIPWLLSAYPALRNAHKVLLVHGMKDNAGMHAEAAAAGWAPQQGLIVHKPPLPKQYSVHHSKAFVLQYATGLRVIVHTANLLYGDFPLKTNASPPSSPFERELLEYFAAVQLPAAAAAELRGVLLAHDFSLARVHLVASAPGAHSGARLHSFGHMRLRSLLSAEPMDVMFAKAPAIAQCSSMGSLDRKWLLEEFLGSLTAGDFQAAAAGQDTGQGSGVTKGMSSFASPGRQSLVSSWAKPRSGAAGDANAAGSSGASGSVRAQPPQAGRTQGITLNFVWPTVQEVRNSIEGWAAGGSIPGSQQNVEKVRAVAIATPQLRFCRWGGEPVGRQRAAPHYKSYTRFVGQRMPWHLTGSHNLSKAAFGTLQKNGSQLFIMHYELAVLSLPSSEAAYRAHPHRGFSCTAPQDQQPRVGQAGPTMGQGAAASEAAASTEAPQSPQQQEQQLPRVEFWTTQAAAAAAAAAAAEAAEEEDGIIRVRLPVPYVLPPQPYESSNAPWMHDVAFQGPDILGRFCGSNFSLYGYLDEAAPGQDGACPVQ